MSIFVKATSAPTPKSDQAKQIALLYAVVLVVMAVAQLFTFEEFLVIINDFQLPLPGVLVYAVAPLLIVCEVFALPFLLRMKVSPAFRVVSMFSSWLVPVKWFLISLWVVTTGQVGETIGFLGSIGSLTPGWWAVLISIALGILAAWSAWGLWPFSRRKK